MVGKEPFGGHSVRTACQEAPDLQKIFVVFLATIERFGTKAKLTSLIVDRALSQPKSGVRRFETE
jgi:hypothetical protein